VVKILEKERALFVRFIKYALTYRKSWLTVIMLEALISLLGLINPYLTKLVVDNAIGNKNLKVFIILALIGGSIFILSGLLSSWSSFLERYIKLKVNFDLNRDIFRRIQSFSLNWFQDKSTGEHMYKISYDVDRVTEFITFIPTRAVAIFPKLLVTLVIIFYFNWKISVLSLSLAPILYLPPYYFSRKMRLVWHALAENSQEIFKNLNEVFSHIQLIKSFGREAHAIHVYLKKLIVNIKISTKNQRLEIVGGFAASLSSKLVTGLIVFYGGYQVIKGQMTLGTLTAIMVYLSQLISLQGQIAMFFQDSVSGFVSCERIAKILNEEDRIRELPGARKADFKSYSISFDQVSFGYRKDKYIIKDLSFQIESGKHIALVGPSGCGKTTLLNLILRLYDPWHGQISIDGVDLKGLEINSLKQRIGVVLQEPFLWNDSIKNNICYGIESVSGAQVDEAARITGVDELVRNLPLGYDTVIGENACKISEGQKQRIAIARALIKSPRILIFDEAFSSLDSASENKILATIKDVYKDITIIIVSHRLSSLSKAEIIYYLKHPETIIIDSFKNLLLNDNEFPKVFVGQNEEF
jgi:ABC-type multidrug transport system fused ATPase/permease subunit